MKKLESFEVKWKAQPFLCTLCWNDAIKEGFYCGYIGMESLRTVTTGPENFRDRFFANY